MDSDNNVAQLRSLLRGTLGLAGVVFLVASFWTPLVSKYPLTFGPGLPFLALALIFTLGIGNSKAPFSTNESNPRS